jgi:hypothetical protein
MTDYVSGAAELDQVLAEIDDSWPEGVEGQVQEEPAAEEPAGDMMILEDPDCQGTVRRIEAIDEFTVEFEMCAPDPAFLSKVAFTAFAIWPSEYLESTGGSGELLERPIGTGPYMIDTWNRGDSIIFTRYPDYWGEPALAETLSCAGAVKRQPAFWSCSPARFTALITRVLMTSRPLPTIRICSCSNARR